METEGVSEELPGWEDVQIKDDFYGEFPPGDHEDLPINTPQDNDNQPLIESEQLDPPSPYVGGDDGLSKSKRSHFGEGILRNIVERFRKSVACNKVGCLSVTWTAGGAAAVFLVLYLRRRILVWRQRQRTLESSTRSLIALVREKDKKINELLVQIAGMNEALLVRRRVPVVRVK